MGFKLLSGMILSVVMTGNVMSTAHYWHQGHFISAGCFLSIFSFCFSLSAMIYIMSRDD